jgi:hypothetical protein
MIDVASKCMDLRLFCMPTFPNGQSLDDYLQNDVKPEYKKVWEWARNAGINVESWEDSFGALQILASRMHMEVIDFCGGAEFSSSHHEWDDQGGTIHVFGTVIQKCVLTEEKRYKGAIPYLFIYMLAVLNIANEAVVEGMCGFVDKHAIGKRGLNFENYAFESIVHYNMPAQAHSNDFIFASLRKYGEMFLGDTFYFQ